MDEMIRDILQWDVKSWSKALHYWDNRVNWDTVENALELGAKKGGLSLWLAQKGVQTVLPTRPGYHNLL